MKEKPKRKQTTLTIEIETNEQLNSYCEKYKITKKMFLECALNYFINQKLDVTKPPLKTDIEMVLKRIENSISIQKNIEQKIILPMKDELIKLTELMTSTFVKVDHTQQTNNHIRQSIVNTETNISIIASQVNTMYEAIEKAKGNRK